MMEFGTYCDDSYSINFSFFLSWKALGILSSPKDVFINIADYSYSEDNIIFLYLLKQKYILVWSLKSSRHVFYTMQFQRSENYL